jgi:hypothetical protein
VTRALVAAAVIVLAAAPSALARERYEVTTLAKVPPPGQPALALVSVDRTIYVGTFTNSAGTANGPSKVFAYSPAGRLVRTFTVQGQDPNADNGVQVAAEDARGGLYLLDQHPARVVRLDPRTGTQSTYATFKDVPPCPPPGVGNECSATLADNPPEPDYAAWGTDGALYVTDYTQAVVWRVPPHGGVAHVWFTDPQLDGTQFGPAGIVLMPDRQTLMLDTSAGGVTGTSPTTGELYTLPIEANGNPGTLTKIWESGPKEAPDGFGLARSGNVYLALVGPAVNQLVVIAPDGHEITRISHDSGDPPFDEPSSVVFDGERVIVTNDAYFSGNPDHFAIFDVFAGEQGAPIFIPGLTKPAPKTRYRLTVRPRKVRAGRRVRLRIVATANGKRLAHARVKLERRRAVTGKRGVVRMRVTLNKGRHAVRLLAGKRRTLAKAYIRAR